MSSISKIPRWLSMTEINCILPDVFVEMILNCCIFYSAKEVIEIRLLSKEYMYLHRRTLIKFRRIYFITKLLLTKNYLSDFKRKALKEGKPYKEPGVYMVRGNKKRGPYLQSIYRCKRCMNKYKNTKPIYQYKYQNRCMCDEEKFVASLK